MRHIKLLCFLAVSTGTLLRADSESCSLSGPDFTGTVSCSEPGFVEFGNGPYLTGVTNGNQASIGTTNGDLMLYQAQTNNTNETFYETVVFDDFVHFVTKPGDVLVVNAQYGAAVPQDIEDFTASLSIDVVGQNGRQNFNLATADPLIDGHPACYHDTCVITNDVLSTDPGDQYVEVQGVLMEKLTPGTDPEFHLNPDVSVGFGVAQYKADGVTPDDFVPEPSSTGLLTLGGSLMVAGLFARRRWAR